ncbi:MAG: flagellar export chaperone FliS [Dethiobacter sp.]|nr:flagellar export chaperone FliS [Dethiobacter sp.]
MLTDPYYQYRQNQVETASPGKLLLMLYNGALKYLRLSKAGIEENNIEKANSGLGKTQDIISELTASLDFNQGEISQKLYSLYDYMYQRLALANIKKDASLIGEVEIMLTELRDAWKTSI